VTNNLDLGVSVNITSLCYSVKSTLTLKADFNNLITPLSDAYDQGTAIAVVLNQAQQSFKSFRDYGIDQIIDLLQHGKLRDFADYSSTLRAAKQFPKILSSSQDLIPKMQKVVDSLVSTGPKFVNSVQLVLTTNYAATFKGEIAQGQIISDRIYEIQSLFAEIIGPIQGIWQNTDFLAKNVGTKTVGVGSPRINGGVVTYYSWVAGSFDLICIDVKPMTWTIKGVPKMFTDIFATIKYPTVSGRTSKTLGLPVLTTCLF
jgi:hypothetical protein